MLQIGDIVEIASKEELFERSQSGSLDGPMVIDGLAWTHGMDMAASKYAKITDIFRNKLFSSNQYPGYYEFRIAGFSQHFNEAMLHIDDRRFAEAVDPEALSVLFFS